MPIMVLMVWSACPSHEVGAIGNYMGKGHGRHPGQLIVSNGFPRISQLCNNLGHLDRIPHHHGIGQLTEARGLVHDLVVVARLKGSLVREEEAPGELMATFSPIDLELHPPAQLDVVDILQQVETL